MNRLLLLVALVVVVLAAAASTTGAPLVGAGPPVATTSGGQVTVNDTWHAMPSWTRNYQTCDAVAAIIVHGTYDVNVLPDGTLTVALGLTNAGQSVEVNIDGTHQHCFG